MELIKIQLEKEGIPVTEYTPKILRFITTTSKWNDVERPVRNDLEKMGVTITEEAPKILRLSITRAGLDWEFKVVKCALDLKVETGDGYVIHIKETNSSIDLYDSCDGAVTRAVTAMFNNDAVLRYLEAPVEPKDSDCDGVPDEIDECPGTPLGMEVDSKGCPLDTDGDGVPDYLDECPDTPKGVKVDSRGCPIDTDGDGVPDYKDQCPGTPEGVKVDNRGCPIDTDGDGVLDYRDQCPGTPKGARVDKEGCWVIDEAFFDFDKYEIKSQYYPVFDAVVSVLRNNPSLKIVIEGHTDIIGTEAYNQKLSEERAGAVMRYLLKKGIDKKRLSVVGYGFTKPRTLDKTKAGRALNRRVKLEPLTKQAK
ncbi:MAG: OmpA family protein [Thermodesulfobacteriota bacterium]|nr:OmpA family protein [Thermodesulfobacteriota bacterium]